MAVLTGGEADGKHEDHNLFRSEPMVYIQMYIGNDAAHDTVYELGMYGLVEFTDLNSKTTSFQREHAAMIKRCEEMERVMRFFRAMVEVDESLSNVINTVRHAAALSLDELEAHLHESEASFVNTNQHLAMLTRSLNESVEHMQVLSRCEELMHSAHTPAFGGKFEYGGPSSPILRGDDMEDSATHLSGRVETLTGTVLNSKLAALECVLFRVSRGNCVVKFAFDSDWMEDPDTGHRVEKRVFCVFFYSAALGASISKVLEAMGCSQYPYISAGRERLRKKTELGDNIREVRGVLERTRETRKRELEDVARKLGGWERFVLREKAVFHTLNKFEGDSGKACVVGEGWCPRSAMDSVQRALQRGMERSGAQVPSVCSEIPAHSSPPTHFRTNKLTAPFQEIVDAYGVGRYREMNPMPFTVITFPFLFAVMFGDVGHGLLMLMFAYYMIRNEEQLAKNTGEIFAIAFGGRYIILLMAVFSIYVGLLYNETFSMAVNLFGSAYEIDADNLVAYKARDAYVFGLDPIWKQSTNELTFTNSLKMKMSIVFGVVQMTLGIFVSAANNFHFRNWICFFHEFIPRILFLWSVFGYMMLVIFVKWGTPYDNNSHCAPSVLTLFIDMFLGFGQVNPVDESCETGQLFDGQQEVQQALLVIAGISVPWMLFAKPLLEHRKHVQATKGFSKFADADAEDGDPIMNGKDNNHDSHHHGEYDFSEEFVHQIIHTIEFVLGAVSNTASYLRLWALSLAHGQLSTVFWEKAMVESMEGGNWAQIMVGCLIWICCTLGVLMVMESLSAFLHALRLHWVEFQNKFYAGDGVKFAPFSFVTLEKERQLS